MRPAQRTRERRHLAEVPSSEIAASMRPAQRTRERQTSSDESSISARRFNEARAKNAGKTLSTCSMRLSMLRCFNEARAKNAGKTVRLRRSHGVPRASMRPAQRTRERPPATHAADGPQRCFNEARAKNAGKTIDRRRSTSSHFERFNEARAKNAGKTSRQPVDDSHCELALQ